MSAQYLVGKKEHDALSDRSFTDALFPNQRIEGNSLTGLEIQHSTFANCSFKGSNFKNSVFENVVFVGCYFRDTDFIDCTLKACKFIDCNLERVDFQSSNLKFYNSFHDSTVPLERIRDALPREGNLRHRLCDNLSRESAKTGDPKTARAYRAEANSGLKRYHKDILRHQIPFYRNKFTTLDRLASLTSLARIYFFQAAWGDRRSYVTILRNWLAFALIGGTLCWLGLAEGLGNSSTSSGARFIFGATSAFPITPPVDLEVHSNWALTSVTTLRVGGLIFSGLFVTLLFSRVYEGRR